MQQIYDTSLMHNNVSHYAKTQFLVQKLGNEKKDFDLVSQGPKNVWKVTQ